MITVSRLLKSWAMPPASRPTASIFWACRRSLLEPPPLGDVAADGLHGNGHAVAALDPARQLEDDAPAFLASRIVTSSCGCGVSGLRVLEQPFALTAQIPAR